LIFSKKNEVKETAHFTLMFDRFFDCLNVTNFNQGTRSLKPFRVPYRDKDDFRINVGASILLFTLHLSFL